MTRAKEERRKKVKSIKNMKYFLLVITIVIQIIVAIICLFSISYLSQYNFPLNDFIFLIFPIIVVWVFVIIFSILLFKYLKIIFKHIIETLVNKNGWVDDNEDKKFAKYPLFLMAIFYTAYFILSLIVDIILYFFYSKNFWIKGLILRFAVVIIIWFGYYILIILMKKFGSYYRKQFIEIEHSKFIIHLEKFFTENQIHFKKFGKGRIFKTQKYEELFSLENGLKIYIINIPKSFMQKQQTNILIGKITPSNQKLAELIKSELNKLEE